MERRQLTVEVEKKPPLVRASLTLPENPPARNIYFDNHEVRFFSSGCTVLDMALGGGYPLGRITNVVGDKSTGKTLLAIEACANFVRMFPKGKIWYLEAEAALGKEYARYLGLPVDRVEFVEKNDTVEDFFEVLEDEVKKGGFSEGLFIVDSLDALSDREELDRKIDEGSYNLGKSKQLSSVFRRICRDIAKANINLFIVSQVRENIGVTFGRKYRRSCGKALDFYASQMVYLAQVDLLKRTIKGVERPIGAQVKAKMDKNKIGLPYRECEFPILFAYGIDDLTASLHWLLSVNRIVDIQPLLGPVKKAADITAIVKEISELPELGFRSMSNDIKKVICNAWEEVETSFLPQRQKYHEA